MKTQQGGFTLIELVVVIVILGILAAVATPRFADLSTQAEQAVADGIFGALSSTSVILLADDTTGASTTATGVPDTIANIIAETTITGGNSVDPASTCAAIDIIVNGNTYGGYSLPADLCT